MQPERYSCRFVRFVGEKISAQAEIFVQIYELRGQNPSSQPERYSCRFVRFVGEKISAQAEVFVQIYELRGQNLSSQSEIFVQIREIRGRKKLKNIRANSWSKKRKYVIRNN